MSTTRLMMAILFFVVRALTDFDVGPALRNRAHDVRKEIDPVDRFDLDLDGESARLPGRHSTSILRSASPSSARMLGQSARWTETPRPRVMYPTISSPGTGLQHLEKRTSKSSIPLTKTLWLEPLSPFEATS